MELAAQSLCTDTLVLEINEMLNMDESREIFGYKYLIPDVTTTSYLRNEMCNYLNKPNGFNFRIFIGLTY